MLAQTGDCVKGLETAEKWVTYPRAAKIQGGFNFSKFSLYKMFLSKRSEN